MANRCERHGLGANGDGVCIICRREANSNSKTSTPSTINPNVVVRNVAVVTFIIIGATIGGRVLFHNVLMARAEQSQIAQERLKEIPITVYVTPRCPWCRKAKEWFLSKQLSITVFDIEHNPSAAREMRRLNPEGGVPTIIIENEVIDGFDVQRIEQVLATLNTR